jgi:hypothetical protein
MVLDYIEEYCLQIKENGDCFLRDVIDIVELFNAVALGVIGCVDREALVVVRGIGLLL